MDPDHLSAIERIVGEGALLRPDRIDRAELQSWGEDRTQGLRGAPGAVALPRTIEEIQEIINYCRKHKIAIVPSGGRTGLAAGAVANQGELVLSLSRMNRLLEFDPYLPALRAEAGRLTAQLQQDAADQNYVFPLDLASAGSSMLGGNLAANAGGIRVIAYGSLRDYVSGLVVVTGAGDIIRFPGEILKNNTGYDLKQLFLGSEGTLGLIVEATVRLAAPPGQARTALAAQDSLAQSLALLAHLRRSGLRLLAFEFFDQSALTAVCRHLQIPPPFAESWPCYSLLEWDAAAGADGNEALEQAIEQDLAADLQIATTSAAQKRFWSYREAISESLSMEYSVHKHDLSAPLARLPDFVRQSAAALVDLPVTPVYFGHAGDGNIHLNLIKAETLSESQFQQMRPELDQRIFELIRQAGGSISAEHGIGLLKRESLPLSRSPVEIAAMRGIKALFDPDGIMNPGKIFA